MGLTVEAKGLSDSFDCGYIAYYHFIKELVEKAYGEKMGFMFTNAIEFHHNFSEEETKYWNEHCNDDLDILIFHSDCDGKFTPQECRKIYNAMKDLKSDMIGHNYGEMTPYNMFERWKSIFKYCADRRVNLYYM